MLLAIEKAKKSKEKPGCGAVIVRDGTVIAKAFNSQRSDCNSSAHAEINAIKKAGALLKSKNLENCEIYSTCEPCVMCLAALSYAKVKKVVYGLSLRETYPKERIIEIDIDYVLGRAPHKFELVKNFMQEECQELLVKRLLV